MKFSDGFHPRQTHAERANAPGLSDVALLHLPVNHMIFNNELQLAEKYLGERPPLCAMYSVCSADVFPFADFRNVNG